VYAPPKVNFQLDTYKMSLIDNTHFDRLAESYYSVDVSNIVIPQQCCDECGITMHMAEYEYICPNCGITKGGAETTGDFEPSSAGSIKMSSMGGRRRTFNISTSSHQAQQRAVRTQLHIAMRNYQNKYSAQAFPLGIIDAVVSAYNDIQQNIIEETSTDGKIETKKFVRRGPIKNEILAALIKSECIRSGISRKNETIATFMDLSSGGFSRGENELQAMAAQGIITLAVEDCVIGFTNRYLNKLGIDDQKNIDFVIDIVRFSDFINLSMSSQESSKVVGAIWLLIVSMKLNITSTQLEIASDNTKKNTFMKFYKALIDSIDTFTPIFREYKIPRPEF
jgi:transcription initiation factor TFIIIB Brf1 subunit/transcription initiation factor TFIIB